MSRTVGHDSHGYTDFLPVTLQQGRNVLLVITRPVSNAFFGFEPGTEYTGVKSRCRLHFFQDTNPYRRHLYPRH